LYDRIARRQVNHSTGAIQELMHTVGVLNPSDGRTASVVDVMRKQIKAMPPHRIFAPDIEVLGRAALLSGILCRLQGYEKDCKLRALAACGFPSQDFGSNRADRHKSERWKHVGET